MKKANHQNTPVGFNNNTSRRMKKVRAMKMMIEQSPLPQFIELLNQVLFIPLWVPQHTSNDLGAQVF